MSNGISLRIEKNGKKNCRDIVKRYTRIRMKQKKYKKKESNITR